jgi:hypothetical protein
LHNETVNIWSHGLGAIVFLLFIVQHLVLHHSAVETVQPTGIAGVPLVLGGRHTPELLHSAMFEVPGDNATLPSSWLMTTRVTLLSSVHDQINALGRAVDMLPSVSTLQHKVLELEATLAKLRDTVVSVQRGVTADSLTALRHVNAAVEAHVSYLVDAGKLQVCSVACARCVCCARRRAVSDCAACRRAGGRCDGARVGRRPRCLRAARVVRPEAYVGRGGHRVLRVQPVGHERGAWQSCLPVHVLLLL